MEITGEELKQKIENGEKVMVDFWATWCGPCRMLKPIFEKVMSENTTEVQMYTMDVEENQDYAVQLGIRAIPTTKAFSNGDEIFSQPGMINENDLKNIVKNLIYG